jgi:1-acyl-sn-glycerol-3-phosphate acyltransferase
VNRFKQEKIIKICKYQKNMVNPISSLIFFPLVLKLFNFRHEGLNGISKDENYIFAINHSSAIDVPLALSAIIPNTGRHLSVVLDSRWYDSIILTPLFRRWQAIRLDAYDKSKRKNVISDSKKFLDKGNNVLIFPEGATIGGSIGQPVKAYTGVIQMAILSKKKIIPVGLTGSYDAWKFPTSISRRCEKEKIPAGLECGYKPKIKINALNDIYNFFEFNFRHPVRMKFGKAFDLGENYDLDLSVVSERNKLKLRELTEDLMKQIAGLAGQEYKC